MNMNKNEFEPKYIFLYGEVFHSLT